MQAARRDSAALKVDHPQAMAPADHPLAMLAAADLPPVTEEVAVDHPLVMVKVARQQDTPEDPTQVDRPATAEQVDPAGNLKRVDKVRGVKVAIQEEGAPRTGLNTSPHKTTQALSSAEQETGSAPAPHHPLQDNRDVQGSELPALQPPQASVPQASVPQVSVPQVSVLPTPRIPLPSTPLSPKNFNSPPIRSPWPQDSITSAKVTASTNSPNEPSNKITMP